VNNVNEAPVATGDTYSVNEDATLTANGAGTNPADLLSNDSDPDGDTLSATLVSGTSNGTLTYTPAPGAIGTPTVTVKAHDDGGTLNGGVDTSAAQTFKINVTYNWTGFFQPIDNNPDQCGDPDQGDGLEQREGGTGHPGQVQPEGKPGRVELRDDE
jgi:hypothetical protein